MAHEFLSITERYTITLHGNGWGYEVEDNITNETLWFQDYDAEQLQKDTNNFEDDNVLRQHFECLYIRGT
jgi:hypothetical protein